MMGYGWEGWGSGFWMLGGLLLVIGRARETPTQGSSRPTPNEILRERFARGEITEQEFEQARKALARTADPAPERSPDA